MVLWYYSHASLLTESGFSIASLLQPPLPFKTRPQTFGPIFFRQNNCGDARITWVVTAMKLLDNSTCRCQLLWGRKAMDDTNGYYYCICFMRYVQWILLSMHTYIYNIYIYTYLLEDESQGQSMPKVQENAWKPGKEPSTSSYLSIEGSSFPRRPISVWSNGTVVAANILR